MGCATLEHRTGDAGDDSGKQYIGKDKTDEPTYRLKTNEDDPAANTYDDLAALIRVINGMGLPSGAFGSDSYRDALEQILDVKAFLRWAAANALLGSWDNDSATPANYYIYNSGPRDAPKKFLDAPYFTFIPWDYDNSLGIDYVGTDWAVHRPARLAGEHRPVLAQGRACGQNIANPSGVNVFANHDFVQYYSGLCGVSAQRGVHPN